MARRGSNGSSPLEGFSHSRLSLYAQMTSERPEEPSGKRTRATERVAPGCPGRDGRIQDVVERKREVGQRHADARAGLTSFSLTERRPLRRQQASGELAIRHLGVDLEDPAVPGCEFLDFE